MTPLESIRRSVFVAGIAAPIACLAATPFLPTWPAQRFLIFYFAPIVSMAAIWIALRIPRWGHATAIAWTLDAVVFSIAAARFVIGESLPLSGHMLFFCHTLLTTTEKWYRVIAILLILETTWFKLVIWDDRITWLNGSLLGLATGACYLINQSRNHS